MKAWGILLIPLLMISGCGNQQEKSDAANAAWTQEYDSRLGEHAKTGSAADGGMEETKQVENQRIAEDTRDMQSRTVDASQTNRPTKMQSADQTYPGQSRSLNTARKSAPADP